MNVETLRTYVLAMPAVTEDMPFGEDVLAFRVCGKIFALLALEANPLRINLKCDPEEALRLRETYPAILPGYHMNKQHWNTVLLNDSLPPALLRDMIQHSYDLIAASLPKALRSELTRKDTKKQD
jgi:predicted DNA-binding protein (MmcQ/YjbR family)